MESWSAMYPEGYSYEFRPTQLCLRCSSFSVRVLMMFQSKRSFVSSPLQRRSLLWHHIVFAGSFRNPIVCKADHITWYARHAFFCVPNLAPTIPNLCHNLLWGGSQPAAPERVKLPCFARKRSLLHFATSKCLCYVSGCCVVQLASTQIALHRLGVSKATSIPLFWPMTCTRIHLHIYTDE